MSNRRFLRVLEQKWNWFESTLSHLTGSHLNPFAHLDTLSIFLLILLIVTGTYLVIFYRPGTERAYATTQAISATFVGSLMRTIHRYTSDALVVVVLLHALRMFLSNRFWGARWLAWTSGWVLLSTIWLIGVMGYWLVWDERAQWITEYIMRLSSGAFALTFTAPDLATKTFAAFVIVLFLHVFVPFLGFAGVAIHVFRLNRSRWWIPLPMVAPVLLALILLAALFPTRSASPADLSRLLSNVKVDILYLGFLGLIQRWGNLTFWTFALLVGGFLFFLPWIGKGKHDGPAQVIESACTGCTLCAVECPYLAIQMVYRPEGGAYPRLAVVTPSKCTGCGICVGACPVEAIDLRSFSARSIIRELENRVIAASREGKKVTLILSCRKHQVFGESSGFSAQPSNAIVSHTWGESGEVIHVSFPCIGMADTDWAPRLLQSGARDAIFLLCPPETCSYREGAKWILARFKRHPDLLRPGVHLLEKTSLCDRELISFLDSLQRGQNPSLLPKGSGETKRSWLPILSSFLIVLAFFTLLLPLEVPFTYNSSDAAGIRLEVNARGKVADYAPITAPGVQLPEGVDMAKILGGKHFPIQLRLIVDGLILRETTIIPAGLRKDGRLSFQELFLLSPGTHRVQIYVNDDETEFRQAFDEELFLERGKVFLLSYDEERGGFYLRK